MEDLEWMSSFVGVRDGLQLEGMDREARPNRQGQEPQTRHTNDYQTIDGMASTASR